MNILLLIWAMVARVLKFSLKIELKAIHVSIKKREIGVNLKINIK